MNDYLIRVVKMWHKQLDVQQFLVFFSVLANSSLRETEYLWEAYRRDAQNFEQVLEFLKEIRLISEEQGTIRIAANLEASLKDFETLKVNEKREWAGEFVINSLFSTQTETTKEVIEYFDKFQSEDGIFIFRPKTSENLRYSDIRNLLMDLGLVEFDSTKKAYVFVRPYLLLESRNLTHSLPIGAFEKLLEVRRELGNIAELIVIRHEQHRLAHMPGIAGQIIHVSKENVNAGYDIESFTEIQNGEYNKRFIEVKAVMKYRPRFFWSRNEVEKAKALGMSYWLYLVPHTAKWGFEIENIEKIRDPYNSLFERPGAWEKNIELYSFVK